MGYYVHAVARTHSFYDDIVVKLPIIIEPMVSDDDGNIVGNVHYYKFTKNRNVYRKIS